MLTLSPLGEGLWGGGTRARGNGANLGTPRRISIKTNLEPLGMIIQRPAHGLAIDPLKGGERCPQLGAFRCDRVLASFPIGRLRTALCQLDAIEVLDLPSVPMTGQPSCVREAIPQFNAVATYSLPTPSNYEGLAIVSRADCADGGRKLFLTIADGESNSYSCSKSLRVAAKSRFQR